MSLRYAVVLAIAAGSLPAAAQPQIAASIQDLGTLGGDRSVAYDVNNRGEVVGVSTDASGEERGFLWTRRDGLIDLKLPFQAAPYDINNRGQIVGQYFIGAVSYAFLWSVHTGFVDLGADRAAAAINDRGQIAGSCGGGTLPARACLYSDGTWTELGTLGGPTSEALAINNRGEVVGASTGTDDFLHAFYWSADTGMIELTGLGQSTAAVGINAAGTIIGWSTKAVLGTVHAVRWNAGQLSILDEGISRAAAINARAQTVGEVGELSDTLAALWTKQGRIVLGTLGGHASAAYAINARGDIVGVSQIANGARRATLWRVRPASVF
jgi:probable HAF family extracellular repeat protein